MITMKFGGTSVGSAPAIQRVCEIIKSRLPQDPVVVTSAVGGITDKLVALTKESATNDASVREKYLSIIESIHMDIIRDLGLQDNQDLLAFIQKGLDRLKELSELKTTSGEAAKIKSDELTSMGEFLSAHILACNLQKMGINGFMMDARDIIVTNSEFGSAKPLFDESKKKAKSQLLPALQEKKIPVLQGFVGRDTFGRITTLGRGGSDYSATLIGAMLDVDIVEIWSDVDGVLTADPSLVPTAKRILTMSFHEAAELAYFGAKVLHPSTLLPAIERNIPVYVLNSMRPAESGTKISNTKNNGQNGECIVKSIAYKEGLTVITVTSTRMLMSHGFMANIFEIFDRYQTSIDLVSTSEVSVSMTIDNTERLRDITNELGRFADVEVKKGNAIVCLVGEAMKSTPGIPGKIFALLDDVPIHLISQGASEINISFVIDEDELEKIINRLHEHFFKNLNPKVFAA